MKNELFDTVGWHLVFWRLMFNNLHSINSKVRGPQISSASHKSENLRTYRIVHFL
jgi:hypothetical protein